MNVRQKQILDYVQRDLPLEARPYAELSRRTGLSEARILAQIRRWRTKGVIRRFGAVLDQRALGLVANCMCVWQVPARQLAAMGRICRAEKSISHCYARRPAKDWPYNFYTMMHCRSREECRRLITRISRVGGITAYAPLFTLKQFKKTSPRYVK